MTTEAKARDGTVRESTRAILVALACTAVAVLLWRISEVAILAFGGVVAAAGWRGLAAPVSRGTGWSARTSVLIVATVTAVLFGLGAWAFGAEMSRQFGQLEELLPQARDRLAQAADQNAALRAVIDSLQQAVSDGSFLSRAGLAAGALFGGLSDLVLILFLSIYLALEPRDYLHGALQLLPPRHRQRVGAAFEDAGAALQQWLLGQFICMAAVGVVVGVTLGLLQVPLALLLGVIAALFEFIPVIGPVLFAIPGLLVALTKGTDTMLYVLVVYVVVQTLESNVLVPLVQRWAVRLPAAVSLLAAFAGFVLFGPIGLIFASPLAVVVMRLIQHLYVEDTLERSS